MNSRPIANATAPSPFHAGEQTLQTRAGKRAAIEAFGQKVIRPFMPDQHRRFFAQLPFVIIGSVDQAGCPWTSILTARPGFIASPDAKTLTLSASRSAGDPLNDALRPQAQVGLLGIDLRTRRRNRLNARVSSVTQDSLTLSVDQSFGNCARYIQQRALECIVDSTGATRQSAPEKLEPPQLLDAAARAMISAADTFFVSSYVHPTDRPEVQGVDVSHRGGKPGFVKVQGNTLTIPDYPGNNYFNTLGNFLINPRAGLMFLDFEAGDILQLTGTVKLINDESIPTSTGQDAERGWCFTPSHGLRLKSSLPFRSGE